MFVWASAGFMFSILTLHYITISAVLQETNMAALWSPILDFLSVRTTTENNIYDSDANS